MLFSCSPHVGSHNCSFFSFFPPPALPCPQFDCDGSGMGACGRLLLVSVSSVELDTSSALLFDAQPQQVSSLWQGAPWIAKPHCVAVSHSFYFWESILDFLSVSPHLRYNQVRIPDVSNVLHVCLYISSFNSTALALAHFFNAFHLESSLASSSLVSQLQPCPHPTSSWQPRWKVFEI